MPQIRGMLGVGPKSLHTDSTSGPAGESKGPWAKTSRNTLLRWVEMMRHCALNIRALVPLR